MFNPVCCFVEIPFCTLVEVELNLQPDEKCEKLDVTKLRCQLEEGDVVAQSTEFERDEHHRICRVLEKDVVRVVVKVLRDEQLEIPAVPCPPPKVC